MDIKITRNGHYDIKENLKIKARNFMRVQVVKIDALFEEHKLV